MYVSWNGNPEFVVPTRISVIESCLYNEASAPKISSDSVKPSIQKFYSRHHNLVKRYGIYVW